VDPRRSFRPIVAIEGPSGAGKTTVVEALSAWAGGIVLCEAFARLLPRPRLTFGSKIELLKIERRLFDEDCRRFVEARQAQRRGLLVWLDTDFLGPLSYAAGLYARKETPWNIVPDLGRIALERAKARRWGLADVYVYLEVPGLVRRNRARGDPTGHPVDLWNRHERVGRFERRFYLNEFSGILPDRFRVAEGRGTVDQIAERILRAVADAAATSNAGSGDARRVVRSLVLRAEAGGDRITRARS